MLAQMTDTLTSILLEHIVREEDSRAHNPEVAGSNPVPATQIIRRRNETMRSTEMMRKFKQIQNIQFWCNIKNWIICRVFIRSCGLCAV